MTEKKRSKIFIRTAQVLTLLFLTTGMASRNAVAENSDTPQMGESTMVSVLYRDYPDLNSLVQASDAIFEAEVIDDGTVIGGGLDKLDTEETIVPVTHYRVKVVGSLKGKERVSNETKIAMLGGVVDGRLFFIEGVPRVERGQKYLVFGQRGGNQPYTVAAGFHAIAKRTGDDGFLAPRGIGNFTRESGLIKSEDVRRATKP